MKVETGPDGARQIPRYGKEAELFPTDACYYVFGAVCHPR